MATNGERTAVKVALISMISAILVALIANADKFRDVAPVPATSVAEATKEAPRPPADEAPLKSTSVAVTTVASPTITVNPTITVQPPRDIPAATPTLATGDRRLIDGWGRSNDGLTRRQSIRNATSQPITRLFISSPDSMVEGPDRLNGIPVAPGQTITIVADDGTGRCRFDMHAVFADGRELFQGNFDVCAGVGFFWQFGSEAPVRG